MRTQIPGNPRESITNSVETIAFQVCHHWEIDPAKLVWIERYTSLGPLERDWYLVPFRKGPPESMFFGPAWKLMTTADWRDLGLRPRGKNSKPHSSG